MNLRVIKKVFSPNIIIYTLIRVVFCSLSDVIHREIENSKKNNQLTLFSITQAQMNEIDFSKLNHLETLWIVGGSITEIPLNIFKLTKLKCLNINNTKIKLLPESIEALINLRCLDISNNTCLDNIPKSINKLPNLISLYFFNDNLVIVKYSLLTYGGGIFEDREQIERIFACICPEYKIKNENKLFLSMYETVSNFFTRHFSVQDVIREPGV